MLQEDVASNKAIGSYGASFIHSQLSNAEKLSVLTHCNTGRYTLVIFTVSLFIAPGGSSLFFFTSLFLWSLPCFLTVIYSISLVLLQLAMALHLVWSVQFIQKECWKGPIAQKHAHSTKWVSIFVVVQDLPIASHSLPFILVFTGTGKQIILSTHNLDFYINY